MSAPENPAPFDLRMLPSWLKEENSAPSYANFDGEDRGPRPDRRGPGNDRRGARPPQARQNRDQGGRPERPSGGSRPPQPGGRPPENRGPRRPDQNDRRSGPPQRRDGSRPPQQEERPAKVSVTFLPEELALSKVTEQLQSAPIAYPLFGVAKMFLQRPERHRVLLKPLPDAKLYRLVETSHISTDRNRLESVAFQELWQKYFRVEVTEAPEIKGNFTSVARSGLTGKVFGPTSHHSFQSAMHKEYEERFSRRMSFQEYRQSIETTNNPEAVELWKTESRRLETYHLISPEERAALEVKVKPAPTEGTAEQHEEVVAESIPEIEKSVAPEPVPESIVETEEIAPETEAPVAETPTAPGFATKSEAETYFRREILPSLIVEVESAILSGQDARNSSDRKLVTAIRIGWESEMRYPLGLVNLIRVKFTGENLHIFKFKKRVLLISSLKPVYLDDKSSAISMSIRNVLQAIQVHPGIDRKGLVEKIVLGDQAASDEIKQTRKNALIGDVHWLIRQGNIIEFSDGTFDLPMGPRALLAEAAKDAAKSSASTAIQSVSESETSPVVTEQ